MARVIPLRDFNLSLAKRLVGDGQIGTSGDGVDYSTALTLTDFIFSDSTNYVEESGGVYTDKTISETLKPADIDSPVYSTISGYNGYDDSNVLSGRFTPIYVRQSGLAASKLVLTINVPQHSTQQPFSYTSIFLIASGSILFVSQQTIETVNRNDSWSKSIEIELPNSN